jgi:hypothetical protein
MLCDYSAALREVADGPLRARHRHFLLANEPLQEHRRLHRLADLLIPCCYTLGVQFVSCMKALKCMAIPRGP